MYLIHSLTVSLPVVNGVASDCSNGSAIDTQPVAQPKPTIIMLAAFPKNINFVVNTYKFFDKFPL